MAHNGVLQGRTGLQVGSWRKGKPDLNRFSRQDSCLYPFLDKDVLLYGDGGWRSGSNDPGLYQRGPRKEDTRRKSHGLLFAFRQPFLSGEHIEKNDWMLKRRENKKGRGSHGVADESSVDSVDDDVDVASKSPRMRDSIAARLDQARHEPLAQSEIAKRPHFTTAQ